MRARRQRTARLLSILAIVLGAGACLPTVDLATAGDIHSIQHVVVIMQENRSFDQYFGTYPGALGIPPGTCVRDPLHGGCAKPYHTTADRNNGAIHSANASETVIDGGKMDGFVEEAEKGCTGGKARCNICTEAEPHSCIDVMSYHDAREIPNYWTYAQNFALQDHMFEPVASWSLPSHLFMVSGWSAICKMNEGNPLTCSGTVNPARPKKASNRWTDITYLLNKHGVSWRYYLFEGKEPDCTQDEEASCETPIQGTNTPGIWNPLLTFSDVKEDNQLGNIQTIKNFFTAAHETSKCGLSNVSWVIPNAEVSEHPNGDKLGGTVSAGQTYVTTVINSIMKSPCWNSTAIFLSWDDWGGFYDQVVPPKIDELGYGIRVPGLVISPYAKAGFIDKQQLSHDAYLKFIQDDFLGGQRLNPKTDGRPDGRPSVREEAPGLGSLAEDFNFNQAPRQPLILKVHPAPGPPSTPPASATATAASAARLQLTGSIERSQPLSEKTLQMVLGCNVRCTLSIAASVGDGSRSLALPTRVVSMSPAHAGTISFALPLAALRRLASSRGGSGLSATVTVSGRGAGQLRRYLAHVQLTGA